MISVVIPLYNEEESLPHFYRELMSEAKQLGPYEVIFVDDGSEDKSITVLKKIAEKDRRIRVFSFRKHHGKAEALSVGFQKAVGENIVTLDADLEDKPSEIPRLLAKLSEGYDAVSGWRQNRKHSWLMILPSRFFNSLTNIFWGLHLHDYNCGLKAYTKEAAKSLYLYGGLYRFIPLLLAQQGFRVGEIAVAHGKRKYGKSKYGFSKIWKDAPDMLTMLFLNKYGRRPLHFFGIAGFILLFAGVVILGYLTVEKLVYGHGIGNRPILFLGMLLVLSGLQVFFTGFLADIFINLSQNKTVSEGDILLKYSTDSHSEE